MDVLFIFPALSKEESYSEIKVSSTAGGFLPPLGIATLAAYLKQHEFSVGILDPLIDNMTLSDVITFIDKKKPKVIGLSTLTSTFDKACEIATAVRKKFPEKIILMGGHHVTIFPEQALSNKDSVDVYVYGEGEITALELLNLIKEKKYDRKTFITDTERLEKIDGIIFKCDGKVVTTRPRKLIENLDDLPMPARELLKMEKYVPLPIEYKKLPTIHMMVSRGCPFNCTYCSTHGAFGYKVRLRSPEKVIEEIEYLQDTYGARQISFWDDVLTINKKWIMKLCDLMIEKKLGIIWNCYAHPNTVTDEPLKRMKQAGCFCIWYGIEAGDDRLLKIINKGTTVESVRKAVRLTQKNGIEVRGLFMVGLPGETKELAQKTIDFAIELGVDYAQFSITTPHIGTKLYEEAPKYGTLKNDYKSYTQHEAVFVPNGYKNKEEVEAMAKRAYKQFYHRPVYIFSQIFKIRNLDDIKRYYHAFRIALSL